MAIAIELPPATIGPRILPLSPNESKSEHQNSHHGF
jgi:hypothetical protein